MVLSCRFRASRSFECAVTRLESWRRHYNTVRPHGSLAYKLPAPEVFAPATAPRAAAQPQPAPPPGNPGQSGGG